MNDTVTLTIPGAVVVFLQEAELKPEAQEAFDAGIRVPGSNRLARRVTATLPIHRYLLGRAWVLAGDPGVENTPSERRGYRLYRQQIAAAI